MYIKYVLCSGGPDGWQRDGGNREKIMPVSSLIVRMSPQDTQGVLEQLSTHPLVSVLHAQPGAVAILTETPDDRTDQHLWKQIEKLAGVGHVELLYHNFEDLEDRSHAAQ
jgi:nitrate reductase NapAB chaperone NapD